MNQFVNSMVLAITKDTPMFSSERLAEAGKMILLGMGAVFSVLALLWGVLAIFKIFSYDLPQKRKKAAEKAPETVAETPVAETVAVAEEPEAVVADDGELIAVISAAIAAYRASEGVSAEYVGGFRVVSYRRAVKGSSWNSK